MKPVQDEYTPPSDEFWTERVQFFTAQLPTHYTKPQKIRGRFHTSEERYSNTRIEIIPIAEKAGNRTYIMMHPYLLEPNLTLTVGLYKNPKHYADQDTAIGEAIGQPKHEGYRETQVGSAQAWYYHTDRTIVVWECFFDRNFRKHPLVDDINMQKLWQSFERWLLHKFPHATTLATPFNDPIAESIGEYQSFLKSLNYSSIAKAAFGKPIKLWKKK